MCDEHTKTATNGKINNKMVDRSPNSNELWVKQKAKETVMEFHFDWRRNKSVCEAGKAEFRLNTNPTLPPAGQADSPQKHKLNPEQVYQELRCSV